MEWWYLKLTLFINEDGLFTLNSCCCFKLFVSVYVFHSLEFVPGVCDCLPRVYATAMPYIYNFHDLCIHTLSYCVHTLYVAEVQHMIL